MKRRQFLQLCGCIGFRASEAAALLGSASQTLATGQERVVFVKAGQAGLIRPVGRKWHFEKDYIEFWNGPRSLIKD